MAFRPSYRAVPQVNPNFWSFAITDVVGATGIAGAVGALKRPLILSRNDLLAYPTLTARVTIACANASTDQPLIREALWCGVPVRALLDEIAPEPGARFARIHAADGYTTVLPFDVLAASLLAFEMDGAPLLAEHGAPARLIAPGQYGYKMPKWVERIELSASSDGGLWETRGFPLDGAAGVRVAVLGHEQSGGSIALNGIAFAGARAPETLHVSIDGGGWQPVAFTPGDPFALTHWRIDWTPPGLGDYSVRVRATAGSDSAEHARVVRVR